jgi:recombinational DNA repair protein (RecF pathway)
VNLPYECLHCGQPINLEDTNVATDVALCRACGQSIPRPTTGPLNVNNLLTPLTILGIWKYKQSHHPTQNFRDFLSTNMPSNRKKDSTTGGE